ncbi:MAG TPA: CHAP domain-containing protein [Acidimicrobiales bacterium]|nr:CHAP domain-containing protein [Acidimicrobiales bacterium]
MTDVSSREIARPPARPRRRPSAAVYRRRRVTAAGALLAVAGLALLVASLLPPAARPPSLTPIEARLVAAADSQLGYRTSPSGTYCNRYSAYWRAGAADCGDANRDEQWCADFAAWVWRRAGVRFAYGQYPGEIDSASASFYTWGVAHRTWHPVGSRYVPRPGDVAVYGLDAAIPTAQHVAVVVAYRHGERGPDVVNGDGSRTGFSVVERGRDQYRADLHGPGGPLAGYVSPELPARAARH